MGPRVTKPKITKTGKTKPDDKGSITINYSEGVELNDISQGSKAKTSFHASGIINSLGGRQMRRSLRTIQEQEQLCILFFQHPDKFDTIPIEKLEKRDICLKYPIEDDYPIFMYIFIAPTSQLKLVNMGTDRHQVNLVMQYNNIDSIGNVAVQLSIFTPSKGKWPPYTYVIYPTNDDTVQSSSPLGF